jgi:hypothetical protein
LEIYVIGEDSFLNFETSGPDLHEDAYDYQMSLEEKMDYPEDEPLFISGNILKKVIRQGRYMIKIGTRKHLQDWH